MIVLDASAAIKIVIDEEKTDIARKTFSKVTALGDPILAPDTMLAEAVNGLWKHLVLLRDISDAQFNTALGDLRVIWENLIVIRTNEMMAASIKVAKSNKMTIYDALYVAISLSKDAPLFTFDQPIIDRSSALGITIL